MRPLKNLCCPEAESRRSRARTTKSRSSAKRHRSNRLPRRRSPTHTRPIGRDRSRARLSVAPTIRQARSSC